MAELVFCSFANVCFTHSHVATPWNLIHFLLKSCKYLGNLLGDYPGKCAFLAFFLPRKKRDVPFLSRPWFLAILADFPQTNGSISRYLGCRLLIDLLDYM
jgi:hypothetical protein